MMLQVGRVRKACELFTNVLKSTWVDERAGEGGRLLQLLAELFKLGECAPRIAWAARESGIVRRDTHLTYQK